MSKKNQRVKSVYGYILKLQKRSDKLIYRLGFNILNIQMWGVDLNNAKKIQSKTVFYSKPLIISEGG